MRIVILLLAAWSAFGQSIFVNTNYTPGSGQAATPTFSPPGGTYTSTQSVTISTTSTGCDAYIWWNLTGNPTGGGGDTHGTSVTVSSSETVYAKVISCPTFTDSAVGSAAYTITTVPSVVQSKVCTLTATGQTCTLDTNWSSSNLLIIGAGWPNPSGTSFSSIVATDGSSTTASKFVAASATSGAFTYGTWQYSLKPAGAGTVLTFNWTGGATVAEVIVAEVKDLPSNAQDGSAGSEAGSDGSTNWTSVDLGAAATSTSELGVCVVYDRFNSTTTITSNGVGTWTGAITNTDSGNTEKLVMLFQTPLAAVGPLATNFGCKGTLSTSETVFVSVGAYK